MRFFKLNDSWSADMSNFYQSPDRFFVMKMFVLFPFPSLILWEFLSYPAFTKIMVNLGNMSLSKTERFWVGRPVDFTAFFDLRLF